MGRHSITQCSACKTILRRCRCMGPHDIKWVLCKGCQRKVGVLLDDPQLGGDLQRHVGRELTVDELAAIRQGIESTLRGIAARGKTASIHSISFKDGTLSVNLEVPVEPIKLTFEIGDLR